MMLSTTSRALKIEAVLPLLHVHGMQLTSRVVLADNKDSTSEDYTYRNVKIFAVEKYQEFVACADRISGDVIRQQYVSDHITQREKGEHFFFAADTEIALKIFKARGCSPEVVQEYRHCDSEKKICSRKPFISEEGGDKETGGIFVKSAAKTDSGFGGDCDAKDDQPFPYMRPSSTEYELELLPLFKIPLELGKITTMEKLYWLLDQYRDDSGTTLWVTINGEEPKPIQLTYLEDKEVRKRMGSLTLMLSWLSEKLSEKHLDTRKTIDYLLSLALADNTVECRVFKSLVESHLNTLLSTPDIVTNVSYELHQISNEHANIMSTIFVDDDSQIIDPNKEDFSSRLRQTPPKKRENGARSQPPYSLSPNGVTRTSGSTPPNAQRPKQLNIYSDEGRLGAPAASNLSKSSTLEIVLIGGSGVGKNPLANNLIGYSYFGNSSYQRKTLKITLMGAYPDEEQVVSDYLNGKVKSNTVFVLVVNGQANRERILSEKDKAVFQYLSQQKARVIIAGNVFREALEPQEEEDVLTKIQNELSALSGLSIYAASDFSESMPPVAVTFTPVSLIGGKLDKLKQMIHGLLFKPEIAPFDDFIKSRILLKPLQRVIENSLSLTEGEVEETIQEQIRATLHEFARQRDVTLPDSWIDTLLEKEKVVSLLTELAESADHLHSFWAEHLAVHDRQKTLEKRVEELSNQCRHLSGILSKTYDQESGSRLLEGLAKLEKINAQRSESIAEVTSQVNGYWLSRVAEAHGLLGLYGSSHPDMFVRSRSEEAASACDIAVNQLMQVDSSNQFIPEKLISAAKSIKQANKDSQHHFETFAQEMKSFLACFGLALPSNDGSLPTETEDDIGDDDGDDVETLTYEIICRIAEGSFYSNFQSEKMKESCRKTAQRVSDGLYKLAEITAGNILPQIQQAIDQSKQTADQSAYVPPLPVRPVPRKYDHYAKHQSVPSDYAKHQSVPPDYAKHQSVPSDYASGLNRAQTQPQVQPALKKSISVASLASVTSVTSVTSTTSAYDGVSATIPGAVLTSICLKADECKKALPSEIVTSLKTLYKRHAGTAKASAKDLFESKFFSLGVVIPVLYAYGYDLFQVKQMIKTQHGAIEALFDIVQQYGFYPFRRHIAGFLSTFIGSGNDNFLRHLEVLVAYKNSPQLMSTPISQSPQASIFAMGDEKIQQLARQYRDEVAATLSETSGLTDSELAEHASKEFYTDLDKYVPKTQAISLEGKFSPSAFEKLRGKLLTKGFQVVFNLQERRNQFTYETTDITDTKRTRKNTKYVGDALIGHHLQTDKIFDQYIGEMTDPIIISVNCVLESLLHAFLVFHNSKTGEYNALQIRQGSYFPEYMNKEQLINYFKIDKKKVVGAISLKKLTEIYGSKLDSSILKQTFRARTTRKDIRYKLAHSNCMTFSLHAFTSTDFNLESFLQSIGLHDLQSPGHITMALAAVAKNKPAVHFPGSENPDIVPEWIMQLDYTEEK